MSSTLTKLVIAVAAVVVPLMTQAEPALAPSAVGQVAAGRDHAAPAAPAAPVAPAAPAGLRTRLLWNDPLHRPHAIADAIAADVERVPPGERIDVSTYWISSRRIARALARAAHRGVRVHVILAGNDKARGYATSRWLMRVLNRPGAPGSWGIWSVGAARGSGGIMHQKSYLFSRVGDARWVVLNGSYNSADSSDVGAYALMWQADGDRGLYDAFREIGRRQAEQRSARRPLRTVAGAGWSAYFLPTADRPGADPVMKRLASLPAGEGTRVRIQMYSMWGARAEWIARRLATLARAGARITLVAGPTVEAPVVDILRSAGVTVRPGCFADGTYTHAKEMSATWVDDGVRRFRTWVGSDNWTSRGTASDEAVLAVDGAAGYRAFGRAFALVSTRTDGVDPSSCFPRAD